MAFATLTINIDIIKQIALNGEDRGIEEEGELVALLEDKYNGFKNSKNIQKGGNMINVYTIDFTNLEYNSIYLFSRLNFIGFYLSVDRLFNLISRTSFYFLISLP